MEDERSRDPFDSSQRERNEEKSRDPFNFNFRGRNEEDASQSRNEVNHFDSIMFGGRRGREENNANQSAENNASLLQLLGQIDLNEMMTHVDTLVTSAKELKPLWGKVKPFIGQWIDKTKS